MSRRDAAARRAVGGERGGSTLPTLLLCLLGPALATLAGIGLAWAVAWLQGLVP